MKDVNRISRRQVVGGVGGGLAVAGAPMAFAQGQGPASPSPHTERSPLSDPALRYARPPFKRQEQPWPGLAAKMMPKPDHGEISYRGSGRLAGRKALITGGDSGIGRAAAIAFAREGADVAINYLPEEETDARDVVGLMKDEGRNAIGIPGDLRSEAFCRTLVDDAIRGLGGLDILVNNAARQQTHASILDITTRTVRLDHENEYLCAVLDHQGGVAAFEAGISDHRNNVRTGLRSFGGSLRLCSDQGCDDELRQIAGEAAGAEGHKSQWRGSGSDLDAATGQRRGNPGEARKLWRNDSAWPAWPTCRTRRDFRPACRFRRELRHRSSLWGRWR